MKGLFLTWVTAITFLLGSSPTAVARPPITYQYNLIAQTGQGFLELGRSVSLNNSGTVSFYAQTAPDIRGVFAGNGTGELTTIAANTDRTAWMRPPLTTSDWWLLQ